MIMRNYRCRGMQPHRYSEPADARDLDQSDPRCRCDAISTFLLPPLASSTSSVLVQLPRYDCIKDISQRVYSLMITSNPGNDTSPLHFSIKLTLEQKFSSIRFKGTKQEKRKERKIKKKDNNEKKIPAKNYKLIDTPIIDF